jgi:hypothetical protein
MTRSLDLVADVESNSGSGKTEADRDCVEFQAGSARAARAAPISPTLLEGLVKAYQQQFSEFCGSK